MVRVGLFVLAFSFVAHVVGPRIVTHLGYGVGSWPYELKGILKHSTELAGWILVGTGVLAGWAAARRPESRSGQFGGAEREPFAGLTRSVTEARVSGRATSACVEAPRPDAAGVGPLLGPCGG